MSASVPYAEVIGDPVDHSLSPAIHLHWLKRLGLEGVYRARALQQEDIAQYLVDRAADPAWRGCNVTMPLKRAVLDHVADPGNIAATIGAANLVYRDDGALIAANTDVAGFAAHIEDTDWSGAKALVIGGGGAAAAVLFALRMLGIGEVAVAARSPLKAMGLLSRIELKGDVLGLDAPPGPVDLLVNASPLGMAGEDAMPDAMLGLPGDPLVFDLVYHPRETPLLKTAKARGLETRDGIDMLIGQAIASFWLLFGRYAEGGGKMPEGSADDVRAMLDARA